MASSNLSPAQKFYSSYFPELLKEPHDKEIYEVNSPFIPNDTGKNLEIENGGMFTCKKTKKTGFPSQFYQMVEGIPKSFEMDYFHLVKAGGFLPDMTDIQNYSQNLFNSKNLTILKYLKNKRSLTDATITKYKIGYNEKDKRILFPILNATGNGITAVKYFEYPYKLSSSKNQMIGYTRLLNYCSLKFAKKSVSKLLYVIDPLDALLLMQEGYYVLCNIDNGNKWFSDWNDIIKNSDVHYFADSINDESIAVANRFKGNAKSVKRVQINNNSISDSFIKGQKSDFDKLVNNAQEITEQVIKNYKIIKEGEASPPPKLKFNIAQDFVQNKMYYGLMVNDELKFIAGDRNLLDPFDLENDGFDLKYTQIDDSNFSASGYKDYVLQNKSIKPSELYSEIKNYIKKYVFLDSDSIYDVLALWIMGTYVFRIFNHYPYIHLQADMGSGKTHLMDVIKPICFNGVTQASQTPAALYREVERNSRTLLLDEVEDLQKTSGFSGAINKVLNSGFQKSGKVARSKGDEIVYYTTYSPKMFAGISDVYSTLANRIIKIQMKKKLDEEKTEMYRDSSELTIIQTSIRDNLYIFGLTYATKIAASYKDNPELHSFLKPLSNRKYDLWAPLFIISEIIDEELDSSKYTLSNSVNDYLKREEYYHKSSGDDSETIKLLETLKELLPNLRYVKTSDDGKILKYLTSDVFDAFKDLPDYKKELTSQGKLTRLLGKVEIINEVENIDQESKRCYLIDISELRKFAKRNDVDLKTEDLIRKKSESSKEFIPKRIIITPDAKNENLTLAIVRRVKKLNPNLEGLIYSNNELPEFPPTLDLSERYQYVKDTIVLAHRSSPFTACFASPGNIVEKMTTTTNFLFHCSSNCTYCYLHNAGGEEIKWRKIYTNMDRWEDEIKKENLVFDFANTLWSAFSFYKEETLPKIPENFKNVVDNFRRKVLNPNSKIQGINDVKKYLKDTLTDKFGELDPAIDFKKVKEIRNNLTKYFKENAKHKLRVNVGEFSDIVRTNHITNHLDYLMRLIQSNKDFRFVFSTKSAEIDDLIKHNGKGRVSITIGFNTHHVISNYEDGTASLDERFVAFNKIQKAKGFHIKPTIEPIIAYSGFKKDYEDLARRMKSELNLGASNIFRIKFGCLRIGPPLFDIIKSNFPGTKLFTETEPMFAPVKPDTKHRYSEPLRLDIYESLLNEFSQYRNKIALGCEYPSIWKKLDLKYKDNIGYYVHQYPG